MDGNLEDRLLDTFLEAAGGPMGTRESVESAGGQLDELTGGAARVATESASDGIYGASASYVGANSSSEPLNAGGGGGSSAGSIATAFLEGGLGVVPLISSLIGLFEGGSSTPAPPEKYELPSSVSFTSAAGADGLSAADFDQMGTPRVYSTNADSHAGGTSGSFGSTGTGGTTFGGSTASSSMPITVNVQTMDAQSFLDNSDQIAQAVRGAMLNLSSINDVVNDL